MLRRMKKLFLLPSITFLVLSALTVAAENTAIQPAPRDANWVKRHEGFVAQAKQGGIEVLFLGDSITDGWRSKGKAVWEKQYAPRQAANFGIGGDRTQHVLWRMEHGELDGIKPKAVVLMIGTNNTGKDQDGKPRNTTPEIVEGVTAIVQGLRAKLPQSKILLLAVFPRGEKDTPIRDQLKEINTALAKLDDGKMVKFLDIGPKFLEPDGTLSKDIMPDLLHPNEKGYQIWADAIESTLTDLVK
jgi:lysophospholipase L1-like esterase